MPRVFGRFSQPCLHCGKQTTPEISCHRRKFCTATCWYAFRRSQHKKKACAVCGKEVPRYIQRERRLSINVSLTCGIECGGLYRRRRKQLNCAWCGAQFEAKRNGSNKFCSLSCRSLSYRDPKNPARENGEWILKCWTCGKDFRRRVKRRSRRTRRTFCSLVCRTSGMRGPNNPSFRGKRRHYRGEDWPERKAEARERDHCTCQYCGCVETKGATVHVDHIIPWLLHQKNDLVNLMCLCQRDHAAKTHAEAYLIRGDMLRFKARMNQLGCPEDRLNQALAWWGAL